MLQFVNEKEAAQHSALPIQSLSSTAEAAEKGTGEALSSVSFSLFRPLIFHQSPPTGLLKRFPGNIFLSSDGGFIGSKYKKVVYREYTDGQFTERKERCEEEEHLEILGPFIRAEVGDSILIVLKNKATHPHSIYGHGVQMGSYLVEPTQPGE
ncbi:hypothetical protein AB205_0218130 [Aquarana catesbeiana]|uniref:Plastocyanin-like domain-containing protein n=1 Tax=Aquarana catesbeiana TaxID=8400 RepID=A0A2G9RG92_AQUCT|nr:hypothetical protein AB205_0218130 [Aquarana catesbeiana]